MGYFWCRPAIRDLSEFKRQTKAKEPLSRCTYIDSAAYPVQFDLFQGQKRLVPLCPLPGKNFDEDQHSCGSVCNTEAGTISHAAGLHGQTNACTIGGRFNFGSIIYSCIMRTRRTGRLAHPYMARFSIFSLLICPST